MTYHILSKCGPWLHCGWVSAFSGFHLDQMQLRILHICELSPQCGWSCVSSNVLLDEMVSHILSKYRTELHCGWACVFSDFELHQKIDCIEDKRVFFLCCGSPFASFEFLIDHRIYFLSRTSIFDTQLTNRIEQSQPFQVMHRLLLNTLIWMMNYFHFYFYTITHWFVSLIFLQF